MITVRGSRLSGPSTRVLRIVSLPRPPWGHMGRESGVLRAGRGGGRDPRHLTPDPCSRGP